MELYYKVETRPKEKCDKIRRNIPIMESHQFFVT